MGTRHLVAVQRNGHYPVAQYGQWDGYPEGQGVTVLGFCSAHLDTREKRDAFKAQIDKCRFISPEDHDQLLKDEGVIADEHGFVLASEMAKFDKKFPELSRDTGAEILELIRTSERGLGLQDSIDFAGDSLFCEYAYVIDLDACTLEVFKGFNKSPLDEGERFHKSPHNESKYYPVKLAGQWELDDLPSKEDFLKQLSPEDEDGE